MGIATTCREAGRYVLEVAEGVGFEPTVRLPVQQFSRLPQSSTLPSLQARLMLARRLKSAWAPLLHYAPGRQRHAPARKGRLT